MKEENKHIIYTADDIKKYITGEMPAAEMHAMEMAALDDAFLAEAMEGYELMEQKDWSKELAALKQTFNKNEKESAPVVAINKKSATKWWKAAAAVVLLGATATTAYIFTNKNNNEAVQDTAIAKTTVIDSVTIATTDSAPSFLNDTAASDSSQQLIAKLDNTNSAIASAEIKIPENTYYKADDNKAADSFIYTPSASSDYLAMKDNSAAGNIGENEEKAEADVYVVSPGSTNNASNSHVAIEEKQFKSKKEVSVQNNNQAAESTDNFSFRNNLNTFTGTVVAPDNTPVGFANINLPQSKKTLYADANGRFTITAPDTALKITIASAGYNTKRITLQNTLAQNQIVLQPQALTTEILATTTKATGKRKEAVRVDSTGIEEDDIDAEPAGGWVAYDNYLSNNLIFPEDAKRKNIHGEVEVTVRLKNNGEISTVKIDKPLCTGCDAEAIRLVKEGPKWDVKNNKKKKVKVKVKF